MTLFTPLVKSMNCARLRPRLVSSGLLLGLAATTVVMMPTATIAIAPATVELAQTSSSRPTLRLGSSGNTVTELQGMLTLLGYFEAPIDGRYELTTEAAVKAFQVDAGLTDDGIVGPATWAKLLPNPSTEFTPPAVPATPPAASDPPSETEDNAPVALPILREGMVGPAVARVQENLQMRGFYEGAIDGIFGPGTEAAVMNFQSSAQLAEDGIVGPATWQALFQ